MTKTKVKNKICKLCGNEFIPFTTTQKYCSRNCVYKMNRETNSGKNNPSYKNGDRINGKNTRTNKHNRACLDYKKNLLSKCGYLYCEICGETNAIRYETHHIFHASLYPKHKELHNPLNLILLCIQCHSDIHNDKIKQIEKNLKQNRGLKELFRGEHHD